RRRRNPTHRPHDATGRCASVFAQGGAPSACAGQRHEAHRRHRARCLCRDARQGVDQDPRSGQGAWDVEGFRLPGGPVYSKTGLRTFPAANAMYRRETYDNYPSARAVMQVVYEGLQLPMDVALRVESCWFAKILRSPEAAAMIRTLFVSTR